MRISDWSSDVCSSDLSARSGHGYLRPSVAQAGARPLSVRHPAKNTRVRSTFLAPCARADAGWTAYTLNSVTHSSDSVEFCSKNSTTSVGGLLIRSEERRVGEERVSTCRYGW